MIVLKNFLIGCFICCLSLSQVSCSESGHEGHGGHESTSVSETVGQNFRAKILSWSNGPQVSGDSVAEMNNECIVEVLLADGSAPEALTVETAFPYMKVHGHGAPDEQITFKIEGNKVTVSKIAFTMSGPWELHIKVSAGGRSEELEIPVVVP
ncbi:MAG: hypothetical protein RJB13_1399 [Pseudomonadota bacterium]